MSAPGSDRILSLLGDDKLSRKRRAKVFHEMDPNGNHLLSLAEINRYMVDVWPEFNNAPALMRAYHAADTDKSGLIGMNEFRKLLKYLLFFNKLWEKFDSLDTDGDHRISKDEFVSGAQLLGGSKIDNPAALFDAMDENEGGTVLFDEFCLTMARKLVVDDDCDDETAEDTRQSVDAAMKAGDGRRVKSGPWWKGRGKLLKMCPSPDTANARYQRRELFRRMNTDGDDSISLDEVKAAVKKMWPEFDNDDCVNMAYRAADRTGDGTIEVKESRLLFKYLIFYDDAWEIFRDLDVNADGVLSEKEFTKGLKLIKGVHVSNPAATFITMDGNGDGSIDLKEFCLWLGRVKMRQDPAAVSDIVHGATAGAPSADKVGSGTNDSMDFAGTLISAGISQAVVTLLIENDVTDVMTLRDMSKEDMKDIGLKIGTISKLTKL